MRLLYNDAQSVLFSFCTGLNEMVSLSDAWGMIW